VLFAQHVGLAGMARRFDVDAVLNTTPVAATLVSVRRPQVTIVHDLRHAVHPEEFSRSEAYYRRLVYHRSIRRSDAVVAISESTRDHVVRELHLAPQDVAVVALGADHVDQWARGVGGSHAVTFAHWSNKRPELAVRAWAILRSGIPGFATRLEVVGVPPGARIGLESLARRFALEGLVRLHGRLPDAEYQRMFTGASVVLLPTSLEGFGLPVIEAQRLGIPVVASAGVGIEAAGGAAAVYAPGDAESFASECRRLFTDDAWRRLVVARGVEHASAYTWKATALATRRIIMEAVRARETGNE